MTLSLRRRVVAAVTATWLALSGCTSTTAAVETATGTASGSVTVWGWNPDAETAPEWVAAFEADNPGITVDYRFIQYSDYVTLLRLGLTSDAGPDVFGLQVGAMTTQFAPLATDLAPALDSSLPAWREQLLAVDQLAVDGRQVGVPWMVTGAGTIEVNKTLLDSVGASVPTNLDQWRDACARLAGAGKKCLVQGAKDGWQNIDVFQALANQSSKGYFYEAVAGRKPFDSPELVRAFEAWKTLVDAGVIQEGAFAQTAYPDAADAFRRGEAGMVAFGTWQNSDMTRARLAQYSRTYGTDLSATEFQIVPFPSVVDPSGTASLVLAGGPDVGWAVSARAKNPAAALVLVRWLAASETSQRKIAATMQQPALTTVPVDTSDVLTGAQRQLVEAQAPALVSMAGPRQIADADVQTALADALAAVGTGTTTPQVAAAAVQRAIDAAR